MLLFDSSFGSFARSFAPFWVIFVFVCVFIWFGFHFQLFALLTIKFFHPHFSWIHRFLVHFEFPHCNFQFSNEFFIFICKQTSSPLHWYSFLFSFFFEFISFTFTFYTIIFENSHLKKKQQKKNDTPRNEVIFLEYSSASNVEYLLIRKPILFSRSFALHIFVSFLQSSLQLNQTNILYIFVIFDALLQHLNTIVFIHFCFSNIKRNKTSRSHRSHIYLFITFSESFDHQMAWFSSDWVLFFVRSFVRSVN